METAVDPAWTDFFVAETGAAAALAGLLVVAISINLKEIIQDPGLPGRAGETVVLVGAALVEASLMLIPDLDPAVRGGLILLVALGAWALSARSELRFFRSSRDDLEFFGTRVVMAQIGLVPAIVAGPLIIAEVEAGPYVLAFGILLSFVVALGNAWVLLVEVLR